MPKYTVERKEVYNQRVKITADNPQQAAELVRQGAGDEDGEPEYHHTMDVNTWNVVGDDGTIHDSVIPGKSV